MPNYFSFNALELQNDALSTLWMEILECGIPLAFHNGLIDLAFLYDHFYGDLPETFVEFVLNTSDWFTLNEDVPGYFDSKYIAEYKAQFKASYLEYVFRKW